VVFRRLSPEQQAAQDLAVLDHQCHSPLDMPGNGGAKSRAVHHRTKPDLDLRRQRQEAADIIRAREADNHARQYGSC
jgi:hypothetical protein